MTSAGSRAPAVSVLMPAWNAAGTLAACLASLRRQTWRDWECLVVDDGSTDATPAIVMAAAREDDRFRLVSRPHAGLIPALNAGLAHCLGPLVARMDADDVMHRDRLEAQVRALEADTTLDAVGCHVRIFPRRGMSTRLREYESWLNSLCTAEDVARDRFVESPVVHPTLMMRRRMASLGYHDCTWPEDYDLILRALGAGMRIGMVPRRLLGWRDRPDSLSRTGDRYAQPEFTRVKAHFLAAVFLAGVEHYILWGYGGTGRALRRALAAHGRTPSHIVEVKPSRMGNHIHGAPVIAPHDLPSAGGGPLVVSVARAGPRAEIRAALAAMAFVEGRDFVCAA